MPRIIYALFETLDIGDVRLLSRFEIRNFSLTTLQVECSRHCRRSPPLSSRNSGPEEHCLDFTKDATNRSKTVVYMKVLKLGIGVLGIFWTARRRFVVMSFRVVSPNPQRDQQEHLPCRRRRGSRCHLRILSRPLGSTIPEATKRRVGPR